LQWRDTRLSWSHSTFGFRAPNWASEQQVGKNNGWPTCFAYLSAPLKLQAHCALALKLSWLCERAEPARQRDNRLLACLPAKWQFVRELKAKISLFGRQTKSFAEFDNERYNLFGQFLLPPEPRGVQNVPLEPGGQEHVAASSLRSDPFGARRLAAPGPKRRERARFWPLNEQPASWLGRQDPGKAKVAPIQTQTRARTRKRALKLQPTTSNLNALAGKLNTEEPIESVHFDRSVCSWSPTGNKRNIYMPSEGPNQSLARARISAARRPFWPSHPLSRPSG